MLFYVDATLEGSAQRHGNRAAPSLANEHEKEEGEV
jgi:hypothetical protein